MYRHEQRGLIGTCRPLVVALVALLAASALVCSCGKKQEAKVEKAYPVVALVIRAGGETDLNDAGSDCWLSASQGASLFARDSLACGAGSCLTVIPGDGSELRFGEGCDFQVNPGEGDGLEIEITRGEVWLASEKDSNSPVLVTPAATVTGSRSGENDFGVKVEPGGATTVTVAGGSATIKSVSGSVTAEKGESAICRPAGSPEGPGEGDPATIDSRPSGFPSLVAMQTDPYFSDELSRDNAEDEAVSRIEIEPMDPWPHVNLGRALLDEGKAGEARSEFDTAVSLDPQHTQALSGIGKIELMEGNWSQAMDAYSRARRADRRSLEAVFGMGQSALGEGDLAEAEKWYKEAYDVDPEDDDTWVALGIVRFLEHDYQTALDDLEKAVSIDPRRTRAYKVMAFLYTLERNAGSAEKYLEKAVEVDPHDYQAWNSLGIQYLRLGQLDKANACFRNLQGAQEAALKSSGYQNIGVVDRERGEARKALGSWEKSRDLTPDRLPAQVNLGQAHLALGETVASLASFTRAVEIDPSYWYPHQWLARAYFAAGMTAEAQAESSAGLALNPLDWASHIVLGLSMATQAGEVTDEAESEFKEGRKLSGEELSPSGHVLLGMSYQCEGEYEKALDQYRLAAKLAPREGVYHRYAGDVLVAMDKEEEALKEYRKSIELDGDDTYARLGAASILVSKGDYAGAAKELERAVEQDPDNPVTRGTYARCLLETDDLEGALSELEAAMLTAGLAPDVLAELLVLRGNVRDRAQEFDAAIADYTQALAVDPGRGDAWFYLAGDLERTGKVIDAREAYRKAVELCGGNEEWKKFATEASEKLNQL